MKFKSMAIVAALSLTISSGAADRRMVVINPGHSHAGIAQSAMVPGVSDTVLVYAPECPELHEYLARIERSNSRRKNPTRWVEKVYVGDDYLEKIPAARKGDFAVLANKNNFKSALILNAVELGYNVLADKPMAIVPGDLPMLEKAYSLAAEKGLVILDMMTERYNAMNVVCRELVSDEAFFGKVTDFRIDDVHHFLKPSGGKTLVRPAWYYDIRQQGEGVADVSTHFLDLAFWECFPGKSVDKSRIKGLKATHNPTVLTKEQFTRSTLCEEFPDFLSGVVKDGKLEVMCNGTIDFEMDGIAIGVKVSWNYVAPEGGGDTFSQVIKGKKATVRILQEESTSYKRVMYVETTSKQAAAALEKIHSRMPFASFEPEAPGKYRLVLDPKQFPSGRFSSGTIVPDFLSYIDDPSSMPSWEAPNTLVKYYVTTEAVRQVSSLPGK
jgi:predicted dehydrogenase